jgi:hypothetical protein
MTDEANGEQVAATSDFDQLAQDAGPAFLLGTDNRAPSTERRRIVRIAGTRESGYHTELVKDYDVLGSVYSAVTGAVREFHAESAMARQIEAADGLMSADPTVEGVGSDEFEGDGGERQYLLQAWQNLAMYIAAADDPDAATKGMSILTLLKDLIAGENQEDLMEPDLQGSQGKSPVAPSGGSGKSKSFGGSSSSGGSRSGGASRPKPGGAARKPAASAKPKKTQFAAADMLNCPNGDCDRTFATQAGVDKHVDSMHGGSC